MSCAAYARLPPPTPEEAAKQQAALEKKALGEEKAGRALEVAQDRVAARYRSRHPGAPRPVTLTAVKK